MHILLCELRSDGCDQRAAWGQYPAQRYYACRLEMKSQEMRFISRRGRSSVERSLVQSHELLQGTVLQESHLSRHSTSSEVDGGWTNVQILMQHPCNAQPLKYQCQLNLTLVSDPVSSCHMARCTLDGKGHDHDGKTRRQEAKSQDGLCVRNHALNRRSYIEAWSHDPNNFELL